MLLASMHLVSGELWRLPWIAKNQSVPSTVVWLQPILQIIVPFCKQFIASNFRSDMHTSSPWNILRNRFQELLHSHAHAFHNFRCLPPHGLFVFICPQQYKYQHNTIRNLCFDAHCDFEIVCIAKIANQV